MNRMNFASEVGSWKLCLQLHFLKKIPGFNARSRHNKDFKNGTWYLLA